MRGIGPIVAADFSAKRRALAEKVGADVVVDPRVTPAIEAWRQADGVRTPVIFEAVGVPGMIDQAMRIAPKDARILIVGACMQQDHIHPMLGIGRELNLQFALGYDPAEFTAALTSIADGKIDLEPWLTATVGIDGDPAGLRRPRRPGRTCQDHGDAVIPEPDAVMPETDAVDMPESEVPESRCLESDVPESEVPESEVPESEMPESATSATESFPRQYARTRRFTLGEPRNLVVSPDGKRIVFIRSKAGDDPINCLYVIDLTTGDERMIADPVTLLVQVDPDDLPAEERARRERMRETASGVTTFATDSDVKVVAFPLAGRLFVAGLISGMARELAVDGPVFDPRPDPGARRVAYVSNDALRIAELDGSSWELASDEDPDVTWGAPTTSPARRWAGTAATGGAPTAEPWPRAASMCHRSARWFISDPASPDQQPREVRYPAAGTANADVGLHVLALDGGSIEIAWDRDRFPYLTAVNWVSPERLLLTVQSRDQRDLQVLEANPTTGDTAPIFTDHDDCWVELVPGTPDQLADGRLVMAGDRDGARRLLIDGDPVTPPDLQVRAVTAVHDGTVIVLANQLDDPTVLDVWQWSDDDLVRISNEPGMHTAVVGGTTTVLRTRVARDMRVGHRGDRRTRAAIVRRGATSRSRRVRAALWRSSPGNRRAAAARPRRLTAAGPARSLRRPARAIRAGIARPVCLVAVVRRPGLRRDRQRRPRHAGPRQRMGARRSSRPRRRCSTTRSRLCMLPPRSSRSTSTASRSGDGASAATWQRWR